MSRSNLVKELEKVKIKLYKNRLIHQDIEDILCRDYRDKLTEKFKNNDVWSEGFKYKVYDFWTHHIWFGMLGDPKRGVEAVCFLTDPKTYAHKKAIEKIKARVDKMDNMGSPYLSGSGHTPPLWITLYWYISADDFNNMRLNIQL